ncbi:Pre-mRNA polyadenylation factor fip1 [Aspergillus cristatus]|uniref:Pre-mRNA polyadenylation factor fip1 n=1 Tax=Aspergillus cristatus TaxID=573508 RepID=A0A1E3BHC0_ASPCR|nr:Pre-mRNA polyadenylation factor fip1 [Aspergillus cristatus]
MEEEDDDFYDPTDVVPPTQAQNNTQNPPSNGHETGDAEEEEIEVEDDEDEFNIITEAPPDAPPPEIPHPRHANLRNDSQRPSSIDASVSKSVTPSATPKVESATPVPVAARPAVPQKPGSAYPPVHASNIDVNVNPVHPVTGKPILLTDMDNDFPADDKPWRRPGSDISDYFNYGFDEFTWASYVLKQQELRREVGDQRKQLDDMQNFMSMGMPPMPGAPPPGPGAGGAPPGMPPMPGMPEMSPDIMQGMLTGMMSQGLDPSSMDPMSFMQHAQAMMGPQPGAAGQPQAQGFGGQGGHQMGYGGYDQRGGFGGRGRGRRW